MLSLAFRTRACASRLPLSIQRPISSPRFFQTSTIKRFPRKTAEGSAHEEVASFQLALKRSKPQEGFQDRVGKPRIRNQVLFVAVGSLLAFSYAASRTNIETEYWKRRLENMSTTWSFQAITTTDLKRVQNAELIRELREWFAGLNRQIQDIPALIRPWVSIAFVSVLQPYADASEGKRLCWKICLLNAGIYLAWKIRRFQPAMAIRFMHNPLSGLSYTMLTSMFSHQGFFHLLLNCLALESFGSAAYFYLMNEQSKAEPPMLESTGAFHFLAFFVSGKSFRLSRFALWANQTPAGLFSGLVSHVASVKLMYPRLIKHLSVPTQTVAKPETWAGALAATSPAPVAAAAAKQTVPSILPSLGASGAVYASVVVTALAFPQSEVALFIPPSYPINIQTGVGALVAFDCLGIMRGWKVFDHWAHLGGAAFGAMYYAYGPEFWNRMRRAFALEPTTSN